MSLNHHRIKARILLIILEDIGKCDIRTSYIKNTPQCLLDLYAEPVHCLEWLSRGQCKSLFF